MTSGYNRGLVWLRVDSLSLVAIWQNLLLSAQHLSLLSNLAPSSLIPLITPLLAYPFSLFKLG